MNIQKYLSEKLSVSVMVGTGLILVAYLFVNGLDRFIISWDTFGYYLFLPQGILHGDLGLQNFEPISYALESQVQTSTFYQASKAETGHWVIKYPMGMAFFYLPFFFIGLFISWLGHFEMNGYSLPFQYAIVVGSVIYMLLGIWLLRKILKHFFSEAVTSITMLLIIFGTNYLQIHTTSHGMPHVYLFTAYAALIWSTIQWYEKRKIGYAVLIGFLIGLMTISRPTEFLAILIPVLYGITSPVSLLHRIKRINKYYKHMLAASIVGALVILPQLIYWKIFAGKWIYNSYNNPGEGLDILSPNTIDFLFSFRKGWLIYTPIMVFALVGIFFVKRSKTNWFFPFILFTTAYIYVSSCWSAWWYATSFSQRTMVQVYPLLALSLGYFISFIIKGKKRRLFFIVLLVVGGLNIFQIWQYRMGIIDGSRMTERYYWLVFGQTKLNKEWDKFLLVKRSVTDQESFKIFQECYTVNTTYYLNHNAVKYVPGNSFNANNTVKMNPNRPSPKFEMKFRDLTLKDHAWIHVTGKLTSSGNLDDLMITNTFTHQLKAYKYKKEGAKEYLNPSKGDTTVFHIMYLTPEIRTINDTYQFYLKNESKHDTISVSELTIDVYQKKNSCE